MSTPFESEEKSWKSFFNTGLPHPGQFEELLTSVRTVISADVFEGAKFDMTKPVSPGFALSHSIAMGSRNAPPSYHFGATYSDMKRGTVSIARIDTSGNLFGRVMHPAGNTLLKGQFQIASGNNPSNVSLEADYRGADFGASVKLLAPGIFGASYLQSVTKRLAVGGDYFTSLIKAAPQAGISVGFRYELPKVVLFSSEDNTPSATTTTPPKGDAQTEDASKESADDAASTATADAVAAAQAITHEAPGSSSLLAKADPLYGASDSIPDIPHTLSEADRKAPNQVGYLSGMYNSGGVAVLGYEHKVSREVRLGTQVEISTASLESIWTFGWEFDLAQSKVSGNVNSMGAISTLVEEKLAPGVSLVMSAQVNYPQDDYRFGYGLVIGQ